MKKCRHRLKCVRETDAKAARRKSRGRCRPSYEEKGGHFTTEEEKVPQVERAGSVKGEVPTKGWCPSAV